MLSSTRMAQNSKHEPGETGGESLLNAQFILARSSKGERNSSKKQIGEPAAQFPR